MTTKTDATTESDDGPAFEPKSQYRLRPLISVTVGKDVAAELHRLAEAEGAMLSHVADRVFRRGLGLGEPPKAA